MVSYLRRVLAYRDFLYFLVVLDVKRRYRQSFVGVAWVLFQPFALTLVFVLVFSRWYREGGEGSVPYALFAYAGLVPWTLFSRALQVGVPGLIAHGAVLKKIAFPREIIPAASVCTAVFDAALSMLGLAALMLYYDVEWSRNALALPAVLAVEVLLAAGLTLLLSAANVFYRDVQFALPFFLQVTLLASPVIYPPDRIPDFLRAYYHFNPLVGVMGLYRWMFLGAPLDPAAAAWSAASAAGAFAAGLFFFKRWERRFADVV